MKKKPSLSVALATYNEEANIERCLKSVSEIADEVIIVDGSSTDKTRDIARKIGAKVIKTTNKPIFHINKQMAVDTCTSDWILAMDADEVVSKDLAKEIVAIMKSSEADIRARAQNPKDTAEQKKWKLFNRHLNLLQQRDNSFNQDAEETVAFFLPRVNMFLGHEMRHTGVYPDGIIRLFKKGKAKFPAKSVHEQLEVTGRVDWLLCDLYHYDSPTFEKYMMRANRYTTLTAKELQTSKTAFSFKNHIYYLFVKPTFVFLQLFFRHKGFLDGIPGFIFSLMSGLHWPMAYMKYWEMEKAGKNVS